MSYRTQQSKWIGGDGVEYTNFSSEGSERVIWTPGGTLGGIFLWVILATGFVASLGAWLYFFCHLGSVLGFLVGG